MSRVSKWPRSLNWKAEWMEMLQREIGNIWSAGDPAALLETLVAPRSALETLIGTDILVEDAVEREAIVVSRSVVEAWPAGVCRHYP